jgi:phosphopentomutase
LEDPCAAQVSERHKSEKVIGQVTIGENKRHYRQARNRQNAATNSSQDTVIGRFELGERGIVFAAVLHLLENIGSRGLQ